MAIDTADYIVVGAGLCGSVVAARLKESDPNLEVFLVEAGSDPVGVPNTETPLGGFSLLGTELDYGYKTTPQPHTAGRVHALAAGKALGGGTTINYGGWLRGDRADYDAWGTHVNDDRWSYEGVLPWMRKSEAYFDTSASAVHHGFHGLIHVRPVSADPSRTYPLREPIKDAWAELGVDYVKPDESNGSIRGLSEIHENSRQGSRQMAHLCYDLKAVRVITEAPVSRVIFDDSGTAIGVELADGRRFGARKEVVLSTGSYRTPQILMLSGVGPAAVLSEHHIPLVRANDAVGANLYDHYAVYFAFRLKDPSRGLALGAPQLSDPAFFKGMPYDWVINECVPSATDPSRTHLELFTAYSPLGFPGIPTDGAHIVACAMLLLPTSRGAVTLASASPSAHPLIDPNYCASAADRAALVHGSRRVLAAMIGTEAMAEYVEVEVPPSGEGIPRLAPLTLGSSDEEIEARIAGTGAQHHHSGGTASMGKVVDAEGKVMGVKGLRVVDASIIPVPLGGHPQATLYAMAEQIAEMMARG